MGTGAIKVCERFEQSAEDVWAAITQVDAMRSWLFAELIAFEARRGFKTEFNVHLDGKDFLHQWEVLEVIPRRKLVYSWRYKGYPGDSSVTWLLDERKSATELQFIHEGHESITGDDLFSYDNGLAGWRYLIGQSLKDYLS